MSEATPPLDAEWIVEVLERHGIEYVIVGGVGARLHGAGRMTYDLDLCPEWERANLDRLAAALRELDARLRDLPADVEFPPITGRTLREMMIDTWRTLATPNGKSRAKVLVSRALPRVTAGTSSGDPLPARRGAARRRAPQ